MAERITVPEFGITITIAEKAGAITSELHEKCEECGQMQCSCEDGPRDFNAAMDGIESLLLALACEGVDVAAPAFVSAIRAAVEACENNL